MTYCRGGSIAQLLEHLISNPAAPGLIPRVPKKISGEKWSKLQELWLEESGQWLENVDWTHVELASDKPVLKYEILLPFNKIFGRSRNLVQLTSAISVALSHLNWLGSCTDGATEPERKKIRSIM